MPSNSPPSLSWRCELPPLASLLPASPEFPPPISDELSLDHTRIADIRKQGEQRRHEVQQVGICRSVASLQAEPEQLAAGSLRQRFQQMKLQVQNRPRPSSEQCRVAREREVAPGIDEASHSLSRARAVEPLRHQAEEILRSELLTKNARIKELEEQVQELQNAVAKRDQELADLRQESGDSPRLQASSRSACSSSTQSELWKPSVDAGIGIEPVVVDVSNDVGQSMVTISNRPSLVGPSVNVSSQRPSVAEERGRGFRDSAPSLAEDVDDLSRRSSVVGLQQEVSRRSSRRCSTLFSDALSPLADRSKRRSHTLELPMCTSLWSKQSSPANSMANSEDDDPPEGALKGLDSVLKGSPNHSPRGTPKGGRSPVRFAGRVDCVSPRASMIQEKLEEKLEHADTQNRKLAEKLEILEEHIGEADLDAPYSTEVYSNETVRGAATLLEQMSSVSKHPQDHVMKKASCKDMPDLTITVSVTRGRRQTDSSYSSIPSDWPSEWSSDPSVGSKRRSTSSSQDARRSPLPASAARKGIIKKASCSSLYSSPRSSRSSRAGSSKAGSSGSAQGTPRMTPRATLTGSLRQLRQ